ncbi:hypothetical protein AKJ16_DCAP24092 [Drosera capensis]
MSLLVCTKNNIYSRASGNDLWDDLASLSDIVSSSENRVVSTLPRSKLFSQRKVDRVSYHARDLRSCHSRHLPAFESQCFSRREMKLSETSLELVICTEQQSDLLLEGNEVTDPMLSKDLPPREDDRERRCKYPRDPPKLGNHRRTVKKVDSGHIQSSKAPYGELQMKHRGLLQRCKECRRSYKKGEPHVKRSPSAYHFSKGWKMKSEGPQNAWRGLENEVRGTPKRLARVAKMEESGADKGWRHKGTLAHGKNLPKAKASWKKNLARTWDLAHGKHLPKREGNVEAKVVFEQRQH